MLPAIVLAATLAVPPKFAVISNSGSTNTVPWRMIVNRDGTAVLDGSPQVKKHLAPALTTKFFTDLDNAGPLENLPAGSCIKSMSFGSSTRVTYKDSTSSDLQCPAPDGATRAIGDDVKAIVNAIDFHPATRGHMSAVPVKLVTPLVMPTVPAMESTPK